MAVTYTEADFNPNPKFYLPDYEQIFTPIGKTIDKILMEIKELSPEDNITLNYKSEEDDCQECFLFTNLDVGLVFYLYKRPESLINFNEFICEHFQIHFPSQLLDECYEYLNSNYIFQYQHNMFIDWERKYLYVMSNEVLDSVSRFVDVMMLSTGEDSIIARQAPNMVFDVL